MVVDSEGKVLASSGNTKEACNDAAGHAELVTMRMAAEKIENWRLSGCRLYVTLEPCLMCLAAMTHFRIEQLYFGAYDPKGGALSLGTSSITILD